MSNDKQPEKIKMQSPSDKKIKFSFDFLGAPSQVPDDKKTSSSWSSWFRIPASSPSIALKNEFLESRKKGNGVEKALEGISNLLGHYESAKPDEKLNLLSLLKLYIQEIVTWGNAEQVNRLCSFLKGNRDSAMIKEGFLDNSPLTEIQTLMKHYNPLTICKLLLNIGHRFRSNNQELADSLYSLAEVYGLLGLKATSHLKDYSNLLAFHPAHQQKLMQLNDSRDAKKYYRIVAREFNTEIAPIKPNLMTMYARYQEGLKNRYNDQYNDLVKKSKDILFKELDILPVVITDMIIKYWLNPLRMEKMVAQESLYPPSLTHENLNEFENHTP